MKFNANQVKSVAIYGLGLAAVVIGAIPQVDVPTGAHAALIAVGGVVVAVERYLQGLPQVVAAKTALAKLHAPIAK
jgi:hypothetical protein